MTYAEAMESYGCDRPDVRYGLKLATVTEAVQDSSFRWDMYMSFCHRHCLYCLLGHIEAMCVLYFAGTLQQRFSKFWYDG